MHVFGGVELAAAEQLDDVPAELRAERLADLVGLQLRQLLFELRHEGAGIAPAEVAAFGRGARILGDHRGHGGEVLALVQDAVADRDQLLLHGCVVLQLVGLDQDVARVHLVDDDLPRCPRSR